MTTINRVLIYKLNQIMEGDKFAKTIQQNTKKILERGKQLVGLKSNKEKVILLGIGGNPASGKTMLIQSIWALFACKNDYIKNMAEYIYDPVSDCKYKSFNGLTESIWLGGAKRSITQSETIDALWNINTYEFGIKPNKQECRIIIRDLPGEMFLNYYTLDKNNVNTLNTMFNQFIKDNKISLKEYRDIFSTGFNAERLKPIQPGDILNPQNINPADSKLAETMAGSTENLRSGFFNWLKNVGYILTGDISQITGNFVAFMFFKCSDFSVWCSSCGENATEIAMTAYDSATTGNQNKTGKYLKCFTQFDKILKDQKLSYTSPKNIDSYWRVMETLYNELDSKTHKYFNVIPTESKLNSRLMHYFIASTAYESNQHSTDYNFLKYPGEAAEAQDKVWGGDNIQWKSSMGVLELIMYIFIKSGIKDYGIPLPQNDNDTMKRKIGLQQI